MRDSQCMRIINYIKEHGSITVRQAEIELEINNVTARLTELRQAGFNLCSEKRERTNRFGEKVRYNEYFLGKAD